MDIDIDTASLNVKEIFKDRITFASIVENGEIKKHNVGIYFQNIPKDKVTDLAAIPYNKAEEFGYLKIDILNLNLLSQFKSKNEIRKLLKIEPDWKMLEDETVVKQLFHLHKHFDIVYQVKPKSISDLSDVLALIRPGKIKLLSKYLINPDSVREELHTKRDKSDLRRSHSLPYAMLIVLNLHLIKINNDNEQDK